MQMRASVYRQRYLLIAIFVATMLIGALFTFLSPRIYTAVASVQLEQQSARVIPNDDLDPAPAIGDADRFLQTQLDRVLSRNMAELVEQRLKVTGNSKYLEALGFESGAADVKKADIVSALQLGVNAQLGLNTRLARISFESRDPAVSALVANAYADELASSNVLTKTETSARAEEYLLRQLAEAKQRMESAETSMLAYARRADLTTTVVPSGNSLSDRGGSLRSQELGKLNDALADATANRIEAQGRWEQVRSVSAMALPEVQTNGTVQSLMTQRAQVQSEMADENARHTSEFPGVNAPAAKAAELDRQIAVASSNIKRSIRDRYAAAMQQEQNLRRTVAGLRGAAMSERERGVTYNALQREVETARAFYDGLLQRYKEVAAAAGAPGENITVVDRAEAPSLPSSPDVRKNLALAAVAGLILALGVGLVRDRTKNVIRSSDDAENSLALNSLGMVPLSTEKRADVALLDRRSPQSEAYYSIATALYHLGGNAIPKTVLFTSSAAGEGKSTSALGVARSLAAMRKRVVLIDGDLRRPSLNRMLGPLVGLGLSDVLAGQANVRDVIQRSDEHGFDVIIAGDSTDDPVSLVSADTMEKAIAELSSIYDVVLIDGPPILGIADAIVLAGHVAVGILVVQANRTDSEELRMAVSRLPAELPLATIITKFNPKSAGLRYGGSSYYKY